MHLRSLRPTPSGILLPSLLAIVAINGGCAVYDDELLSKSDAGKPSADATNDARDPQPKDGATPPESGPAEDGSPPRDAGADTGLPDSGADGPPANPEGGAIDADGAVVDGALADAGDLRDAGVDARNTDTSPPPADAMADTTAPDAGDTDSAIDAPPIDGGSDAVDSGTDSGASSATLRVVRVGDGTAAISSASAAVFIEERTLTGGAAGATIALPVASSGAQQPLTLAGSALSEGSLSLSSDGRFLTLAGYATPPGLDSVATNAAVNRVAGRISAAGVVDTTTLLGSAAFTGAAVRGATSADGSGFWVAGTGGISGGIWYVAFGASTGAQIVATPDNVRWLHVFGGQLYGTSGASPMTDVFAVGTGLPQTGSPLALPLTGMPLAGMSPYSFALFDRSSAVPGLDTLYVADDRTPASDGSGGGVQKWTFGGASWSRVATFATVNTGTTSVAFRGLAGVVTGQAVTLVATTAEPSANRLVVIVDDGAAAPVGTVVATAAANTLFRGVAFSPR
jgi:hypothetical protein